MPPLIVAESLHHSFSDGWDALNGINLTIESGEYLALIGPNGSGKTTLAKHMNGLLRPTKGRVLVAGQDTRQVSCASLAPSVGYVFQNPDNQIFCPSVWEELAFAPRAIGMDSTTIEQRVAQELAAFSLGDYQDRPPAILTPGLRRRVALASVLTLQPKLLILDEPSVGLDAQEREDVFTRIGAYQLQGNSIILISHDMSLVARWAKRCLLLHSGQILADGPTASVLANANVLAQAGMQLPALPLLAQRLADCGMPGELLQVSEFGAAYLNLRRGAM